MRKHTMAPSGRDKPSSYWKSQVNSGDLEYDSQNSTSTSCVAFFVCKIDNTWLWLSVSQLGNLPGKLYSHSLKPQTRDFDRSTVQPETILCSPSSASDNDAIFSVSTKKRVQGKRKSCRIRFRRFESNYHIPVRDLDTPLVSYTRFLNPALWQPYTLSKSWCQRSTTRYSTVR